jgi:glycerol-1-phosphate dehydrogenase [NAD(P)+]
MIVDFPIYVGHDAIARLIVYCQHHNLKQFIIVSDENTYSALGVRVESALQRHEFDVKTVIFSGPEVRADENYLTQLLLAADRNKRMFIAVGSGTITDITRLISHRTRGNFISMPTAPSVDGFSSKGAPLIVGGLKQTIIAHPPIAIFADLPTLQAAPPELIAAGFGDMMGKFTSLADWKLGYLLWDEPYNEHIAARSLKAVQTCADQAGAIGERSTQGISSLMDGLIESGLCTLNFGSSRPASGAEHHCSHYWEMKLLQEKRLALLHGAKVGLGTILIAERYEKLRQLTEAQVIEQLEKATLPDRTEEMKAIEKAYGSIKESIFQAQLPFLDLSDAEFERLKSRIAQNWSQIQEIAATVPSSSQITDWLLQAGAATTASEVGLSTYEVDLALRNSHYLRNRFTIMKLNRILHVD